MYSGSCPAMNRGGPPAKMKLKTVSERAPPAREEMGLSLPQTKPAN